MPSIEMSTSSPEDLSGKAHSDYFETTEKTAYVSDAVESLSESHKAYLIERHGTLELDPVPSMDPADPYNWPAFKKTLNLVLVAFHACMGTFTAAAIIPAYESISEDLGVSIQRTSYLTSLQIAILGGAPLLWKPLSNRFGRRPIFLLSLILSCVCNIGCARSPDYASMAACRALVAFFISPAMAIGSAVVTEMFFRHQRARYMGIWAVMVTLGVPIGPFIFGFVTERVGYRWIFWILAITNAVEFLLYLPFGPETRYVGTDLHSSTTSTFKREYLTLFHRIDPTPFRAAEFYHPLTLFTNIPVLIASVAYAMVFLFGSVMNSVEVPQLLQVKFGLNAQQLGLQFLGLIIGSLLGEQLGGVLSDTWMNLRAKRTGHPPAPEYRLWLSYVGYLVTMAGMVVFLVCTAQAEEGQWTVVPVVGTAIAAFGNQVVTTVMITYAVDTYPADAGSVGVFINFVRSTWGFIGPFWFTDLFDSVGVAESSGVVVALIVGASVLPTVWVHWRGGRYRRD
ncbi:MFS multidrug transporter [Aspergillus japonicus CBS 114.51]|uniref:MFS multidrug transporter n=2 Tax=Aspergillus TaxID=5052 RepID=A0A2V5GXJ9_ASPV1|nr:MFS multidrug transporter [Aspergillus japonicus CBS 114.51]PYI16155.1 MFS multidrug transporter [Aspergillus violaceofuscus CBS 115571]RAH77736.1 MFS multidrug transporter [Aspergillus japonicus CBS 114.51]